MGGHTGILWGPGLCQNQKWRTAILHFASCPILQCRILTHSKPQNDIWEEKTWTKERTKNLTFFVARTCTKAAVFLLSFSSEALTFCGPLLEPFRTSGAARIHAR